MRSLKTLALLSIVVLGLAGCQGADVVSPNQSNLQNGSVLPAGENVVPFHAKVMNTFEVVPPFPPPLTNAIFRGSGKSRPFGSFVLYATSQIDVTVYPNYQTSQGELAFPNGDKVYWTGVGIGVPDPTGTSSAFSGDLTFAGGTGRFSNATGTATYAGVADFIGGTAEWTIDGVIASFGGPGN